MSKFIKHLSLMCFVFYTYAANMSDCHTGKCVAILDAGSTSSKLHIYYKESTNLIQEIFYKKMMTGVATFPPNENSISAYLRDLFSEELNNTIPVYFYATAGMRIYPNDKQKIYYELIEHWFAKQSHWQLKSARTITGQEEAVFGWLAVNYNLGNLSSNSHLAGVLDMGGASVEIAFPVKNKTGINRHDLYTIHFNNREIVLFARSFLGLGQTLLSQQFLNQESCFANGYVLPDAKIGKGDASQCRESISRLINNVHSVDTQAQTALKQNQQQIWYTMGALEYMYNSIFFHWDEANILKMQSFFDQVNENYCHQSWTELTMQYPNQEYLYSLCLNGSYYYSLVVDGYGISPNEIIHIPNNNGWDWTLGALLQEALFF